MQFADFSFTRQYTLPRIPIIADAQPVPAKPDTIARNNAFAISQRRPHLHRRRQRIGDTNTANKRLQIDRGGHLFQQIAGARRHARSRSLGFDQGKIAFFQTGKGRTQRLNLLDTNRFQGIAEHGFHRCFPAAINL